MGSRRILFGLGIAVCLGLSISEPSPSAAFADATCMDGWHSYSSGQGTCSHHGGVYEWLPSMTQPYNIPKVQSVTKPPKSNVDIQTYDWFVNCKQLRKKYPNGIAVNSGASARKLNVNRKRPQVRPFVYAVNVKLDGDRDGAVCELDDWLWFRFW